MEKNHHKLSFAFPMKNQKDKQNDEEYKNESSNISEKPDFVEKRMTAEEIYLCQSKQFIMDIHLSQLF